MVYLLLNGVDIEKSQVDTQEKRVPYLEYRDPVTKNITANLASPRLLKSHLPCHLLPGQVKEKRNKVSTHYSMWLF